MRGKLFALALIGLAGSTVVRAQWSADPDGAGRSRRCGCHTSAFEVEIVGQVATTKVEQSYRNTTNRDLEAEYIFPLPAGASVRDFSMWVGGKRYKGEAVDASAARQTYEDIVRRLQDPGLLEYIGRDLWKVRIYPVPRRGEQKIEITLHVDLAGRGRRALLPVPPAQRAIRPHHRKRLHDGGAHPGPERARARFIARATMCSSSAGAIAKPS